MNEKKIQGLLERRWYFQGFNGTLALLFGAARSAPVNMPKRLGYGYTGLILYFEDDKCYFLYDWSDIHNIHDELLKRVRANNDYLEFLEEEDNKACQETMDIFYKVKGLEKLDDAALKKIYSETQEACANLLSVSHIVEGWVHATEDIIRKKVGDKDKLAILTTPSFDSFLTKEMKSLFRIADHVKNKGQPKIDEGLIKKDKKIFEMLDKHQKKYFWINNSYSSSKILPMGHFLKEVNSIIRSRKEEIDLERIRKEKEKILKSSDEELKELIRINDAIFRIHDRRKEHLTISVHYIERILKEIHRRTKVPMELLRYLLPEDQEIDKGVLKERRKQCIYLIYPDKYDIYTGEEASKHIGILEEQIKADKTDIIKGNGASSGIVKGKVKVCRGEREISKVEKGDILVACMTQPEFVPAMKKASAIVTDEGGLTCHAAIVSRELGIPCVIGTKKATKVLNDGDLVEVDANHGLVKIIKD